MIEEQKTRYDEEKRYANLCNASRDPFSEKGKVGWCLDMNRHDKHRADDAHVLNLLTCLFGNLHFFLASLMNPTAKKKERNLPDLHSMKAVGIARTECR